MLKIFKSFNPQTIIILMVFSILLKFGYYIHPPTLFIGEDEWGFAWIVFWIQEVTGIGTYGFITIGILNLVLQSLFVNRIATEYKLLQTESFVPAALFMMLSTLIPSWNILSAPLIANWFILFTLNNIIRLPFTATPKKLIYNCGLFIGIGTLFYYPILLLLIMPIWAMNIVNPLKLKDIIIYILGISTIFYFWACFTYLLDGEWQTFKVKQIHVENFTQIINSPAKLWPIIGILTLLLALGFIILSTYRQKQVESIKNIWSIILLSFISMQILSLINANNQPNVWLFALAPTTLISVNLWISETKKWVKICMFWLLLCTIIYSQYF